LKRFSIILFCLLSFFGYGQSVKNTAYTDSVRLVQSLHYIDSMKAAQLQTPLRLDTIIYRHHPYLRFTQPVKMIISERKWQGKEGIFYGIMGLLLFFAFIRNGFSRYIKDVFGLFFRTTIRQRQIKEQMMQSPLPSLLLNLLFVLSAGLFATLLLRYYHLAASIPFWYLFLYCLAGIAGIYIVKYLTLKFSGWLFHLSESTNAYIFIVFMTNKIIGILLLPFLLLLGFSGGIMYQVSLTLCVILLCGLFAYRFYLSYISIHKQVKINFFHFLLYLAAFEVVPLLLINKLLVMFFS